jgi:hypothetical protein
MNERFPQMFFGLTALAIGFIVAAVIVSGSLVKIKRSSEPLTVTGSAKKQITSDYVVWNGSVSRKSADMTAAFNAVKKDGDRVRQFFKDKNVPDDAVEYAPIGSSEESWTETQADGSEKTYWQWVMTQSFTISSNDVNGITELSKEITDLIGEGIGLQSYNPQYYYTKIADLRVEMLGLATKDAMLRAKTIVESAGGRLGPLSSARMGVFQITQPNSTEVDDYGIYDTSSIDKEITAVVKLTFAVE